MSNSATDVIRSENRPQTNLVTLHNYLNPKHVVIDLRVKSRKRLFEEIARLISETNTAETVNAEQDDANPNPETIFDTLHGRERLGCTALGKGIAIPHGRIQGLSEPLISIARLENAIDYDAPDGVPVWLAVCLLVPAEANEVHLNILAALATKFNDDQFVQEVKQSRTATDLYNLFAEI